MRRIAALVLPELLLEIATAGTPQYGQRPFGVVLVEPGARTEGSAESCIEPTAELAAVSAPARRCGVFAGQTITAASALVAGLGVARVTLASVEAALAAVADVALGFGAIVAVKSPDTVWVELGGSAHLFGGEEALCEELAGRVRALGHAVRLAVADGPELARAFARWGALKPGKATRIVPSERSAEEVRALPVVALPLDEEGRGFLVRLGVLTLGDLAALPRSAVAGRLDGAVAKALDLAVGIDETPLVPYQPARTLEESIGFEHGASGIEPLLFALRGLAARLAARLAGRAEAAETLTLEIEHDRVIARLHGAKPTTLLRFSLATPLHREEDLRRIVVARLERLRLPAPSVGLRLAAPLLVPAVQRQLELGEALSGSAHARDELPLVLAELRSDVGEERVGTLRVLDSHRLEAQSALVPTPGAAGDARSSAGKCRRSKRSLRTSETSVPIAVHVSGAPFGALVGDVERAPFTRLLSEPLRLEAALRVGSTLAVDHRLFSIEQLRFEQRLYAVEWWTRAPVQRDYVRLWLRSTDGVVEALAFVDRASGKRYLQAVAD